MESGILCTLTPSPARRGIAVLCLSAVAALLLWVAVTSPPNDLGWLAFTVGTGAFMLWCAWQLWAATARRIVLTREGLFDSSGACLARIDDIANVDRGVFAFKPSGGFAIVLKTPLGRDWAPGLWWRFGRRLGIGGVTPNAQGKVLAEAITLMLMEKNGTTL
ncbi:hypothetical protein DKT77_08125 [Meridianimarinicoccus roseus]|jgi:hypothetical protein|uniref:PH (Pleckstrin Homology) domain-containing protein n=1 Tax=Meridianimarinicoccus roseus TaxID=2072018 RepID=A0A2V2LGT6_9RHOB|nr:hypothetical protein [Meridianimarinicoccus roseus]PWR03171.1 hypothetical protein DKT77_08125 [Meridianimarinicoccus roseus]